MKFHRGRLIDHVHLVVDDLEASRRFYRAVFGAIGREFTWDEPGFFTSDELFVSPLDGKTPSHVHLAFQAVGPEMVQGFYSVALAAGGKDNGAPGYRDYHPGYYGAFVLDPDGNNIETVYHGPAKRSATSVEITAEVSA